MTAEDQKSNPRRALHQELARLNTLHPQTSPEARERLILVHEERRQALSALLHEELAQYLGQTSRPPGRPATLTSLDDSLQTLADELAGLGLHFWGWLQESDSGELTETARANESARLALAHLGFPEETSLPGAVERALQAAHQPAFTRHRAKKKPLDA